MNKVVRRAVTLVPPLVYIALFVFLEIYAFFHSRQANLGLAVLMGFGPLCVGFTYARLRHHHHVIEGDPLRPYYPKVLVAFIIAAGWFYIGAALVEDPEGQVMIAIGPVVIVFVLVVGYVSDRVSKARRKEYSESTPEEEEG